MPLLCEPAIANRADSSVNRSERTYDAANGGTDCEGATPQPGEREVRSEKRGRGARAGVFQGRSAALKVDGGRREDRG